MKIIRQRFCPTKNNADICKTFCKWQEIPKMKVEEHPLEPFLPKNAKMLFLGSFPPPRARWSMDFFYPNWINDFWRIMGLVHFNDKAYFEAPPQPVAGKEQQPKRFDKERIVSFCHQQGIALFDTVRKVCRLKDNADDNFLQTLESTDVFALLRQMPDCQTLITTGGKASEELQAYLEKRGITADVPKVGTSLRFSFRQETDRGSQERTLTWWRMPSSSRAYPMKLEKKAECYRMLWK